MYQSSFLNDSSTSIREQKVIQSKYEMELSEYRQKLRQYQYENRVLGNENNGLRKENMILKQLLQEQKVLIVKLNDTLITSNHQINRLEDKLQNEQKNNMKMKQMQNQIAEYEKVLQQMKMERKVILEDKQDYLKMKKEYQAQIQIKQNEMIQCRDKSVREYNQLRNQIEEQIIRICTLQSNDYLSYQNILSKSVITYLQQQRQTHLKRKLQLQQLRQELQIKSGKLLSTEQMIMISQVKYKQANKQQQQVYKKQIEKISKQVYILSKKVIQFNNNNSFILNCLAKLLPNQLIQLLQKVVMGQSNQIIKNQINHFCLGQSKLSIRKQYAYNNSNILENQILKLNQQLSFANIKFNTLKRQYNEIVGDNHRLLKFHKLSLYKQSRNYIKIQQSDQKSKYCQKHNSNRSIQINSTKQNDEQMGSKLPQRKYIPIDNRLIMGKQNNSSIAN